MGGNMANHCFVFLLIYHLSLSAVAAAAGRRDVVTPTISVPTINPSTSSPAFTPYMMPSIPAAAAAEDPGRSWCVAMPTASAAELQAALDYACGPRGGADCSAIQPGAGCYDPDTVRGHASYAFNYCYQRNPIPASCDFGGTAITTSTDPSTPACSYPSTSMSTSVLNTTNPAGLAVFGSAPPGSGAVVASSSTAPFIFMACLAVSLVRVDGIK